VGRKTHRLGSEKEEWGKGRRRETHSNVEKSSQSAVFHTNAEIVIRTSKFIFIFTVVTQQKEATPWGSFEVSYCSLGSPLVLRVAWL
jgi:hypothetical protein